MIDQEFIDLLRCPLEPSGTRLEAADGGLACTRCRLLFPVREQIPCLVPEEAKLPAGCATMDDLPCRKAAT